jgi:hypothetical protein
MSGRALLQLQARALRLLREHLGRQIQRRTHRSLAVVAGQLGANPGQKRKKKYHTEQAQGQRRG